MKSVTLVRLVALIVAQRSVRSVVPVTPVRPVVPERLVVVGRPVKSVDVGSAGEQAWCCWRW